MKMAGKHRDPSILQYVYSKNNKNGAKIWKWLENRDPSILQSICGKIIKMVGKHSEPGILQSICGKIIKMAQKDENGGKT